MGGGISIHEGRKILGREQFDELAQKQLQNRKLTLLYERTHLYAPTHIGTSKWALDFVVGMIKQALEEVLKERPIRDCQDPQNNQAKITVH